LITQPSAVSVSEETPILVTEQDIIAVIMWIAKHVFVTLHKEKEQEALREAELTELYYAVISTTG
jgi:hypothetical protein